MAHTACRRRCSVRLERGFGGKPCHTWLDAEASPTDPKRFPRHPVPKILTPETCPTRRFWLTVIDSSILPSRSHPIPRPRPQTRAFDVDTLELHVSKTWARHDRGGTRPMEAVCVHRILRSGISWRCLWTGLYAGLLLACLDSACGQNPTTTPEGAAQQRRGAETGLSAGRAGLDSSG